MGMVEADMDMDADIVAIGGCKHVRSISNRKQDMLSRNGNASPD